MSYCETCGHQFSDICGTCVTIEGVPVKYSEKPKPTTLPDELTPYAVKLITKCPQLINMFAAKINCMINNWECDEIQKPQPQTEPIDDLHIIYTGDMQELIAHVGYDKAQCGYDK